MCTMQKILSFIMFFYVPCFMLVYLAIFSKHRIKLFAISFTCKNTKMSSDSVFRFLEDEKFCWQIDFYPFLCFLALQMYFLLGFNIFLCLFYIFQIMFMMIESCKGIHLYYDVRVDWSTAKTPILFDNNFQ